MRFKFVEKIEEFDSQSISGLVVCPADHPLRYAGPNGQSQIAPGVIGEAIGQLASWLCMQKTDFAFRPVFLFTEKVEILSPVVAGSTVDLKATITQMNSDSFIFSGEASVDGKVVQRVLSCSNYFMPLENVEDPAVTKAEFAQLTSTGINYANHGEAFDFDVVVQSVDQLEPGKLIVATNQIDPSAAFYADHFPRFAVTPVVMLNEVIAKVAAKLFADKNMLFPVQATDIKIRSFVAPGETFEVRIEVQEERAGSGDTPPEFVAQTQLLKRGKRIFVGNHTFALYPKN